MPMESAAPPLRSIGNYEILEKIAEGGMGAVYKGRHKGLGQIVAIKIVPPDTAKNQILLKRFEMEFRAASVLDHPNIVKALDYNAIGTPFLVMEYVDGLSLGQKVERDGPIPEREAVEIIAQVCDGLHKAHKQSLIHRDVKPDNILLTADGVAKLTDMGLVKDADAELNLTRTGRGLGTPHFMAPEQFRNAKNADVRCDVYSLGATLYMLLTGEIPFNKTNPLDCWMKKVKNDFPAPRKLNPAISERVDWAVRRAMSADPAQRPATCREFVEDLTGNAAAVHGPPSTAVTQASESATRLESATPRSSATTIEDVLWYMVYTGPDGQQHNVKGLTSSIRENLRKGALGDPMIIMVSRTKTGPFMPLRQTLEFRDMIVSPAPVLPTSRTPAAPMPGERTYRLPSPEPVGPDIDTPTPPRMPPQATFDPPAASRTNAKPFNPIDLSTYPLWLPWTLIGVLTAGVLILAVLVLRRGS
jgi:serine/threonine protein kinase